MQVPRPLCTLCPRIFEGCHQDDLSGFIWRRSCHEKCLRIAVRPPPCVQSIRVLRVLCREEFSIAAAKTFVEDVKRAMDWLTGHFLYTPEQVL